MAGGSVAAGGLLGASSPAGAAADLAAGPGAGSYESLGITNVKDHGAKGDGHTDDAAAINAAIAATAYGGTVWFPPGTYRVRSTVRLKAAIRYTGPSDLGATIEQAPGANLHAVAADAGYLDGSESVSHGFTVEFLTIDGRNDANSVGHGLILMNWRCLIRKVRILKTPESGIVISDLNINGKSPGGVEIENRIEDCSIDLPAGYGIWVMDHNFSGKATDGYLLNNVVSSAGAPFAMRIDRAAGWFIDNNHVYNSLKGGYFLDQVWCTYFSNNEVDTFGLDGAAGATYTGVRAEYLLVNGRPSIFLGNVSATAQQQSPRSTFVHFHFVGNQPGTARVTVVANVAHCDAQLDPSPVRGAQSQSSSGFKYEAQTGGVLEVTEIANRSDGVRTPFDVPQGGGSVQFLTDSPSLSLVHAKGDLLVGTGPGQMSGLPVGNDGDVLVADHTAPGGVRWETP